VIYTPLHAATSNTVINPVCCESERRKLEIVAQVQVDADHKAHTGGMGDVRGQRQVTVDDLAEIVDMSGKL